MLKHTASNNTNCHSGLLCSCLRWKWNVSHNSKIMSYRSSYGAKLDKKFDNQDHTYFCLVREAGGGGKEGGSLKFHFTK